MSDSTVEVIQADKYNNQLYYYGDIKVPSTIKYYNTEYKVTSIGDSAFCGCDNLYSIELPEGITSIGDYAFCDCDNLYSIELPEGITSIGGDAFMGCKNLCSVNIPENVTVIEPATFWRCPSLKSITIPDNVKKIGGYAFAKCESLTEITLPNSVEYLGYYSFSECQSLAKINLSASLTSLPISCFEGCSSLHEITLPESIVSISHNAFKACPLESMTVLANEVVDLPPYGPTNGLRGIEDASLYVPSHLVESYKNHEIWSDHFSQILPLDDRSGTGGVEEIELDSSLPFDVYTLSGVLVRRNAMKENLPDLAPGVYILRQGNASRRILLR